MIQSSNPAQLRPTQRRVLLSTQWLGGDGGAERHASQMITALAMHHVDVLAPQHIKSGYYTKPERGSAPHRFRWRRPSKRSKVEQMLWGLAQPVVGFRHRPYDILIEFAVGSRLDRRFGAKVRAIDLNGSFLQGTECNYDFVIMEAPSNIEMYDDHGKGVLMPPAVEPLHEPSQEVHSLPSEFILTVFNPHGTVKGTELLEAVADIAPIPIIWCHGTATKSWSYPTSLNSHPNIVHKENMSQAQLVFLYQRCQTFLSLSLREGYGFAIGDALQYGAPIISRRTGILTLPDLDLVGTHFYSELDELHELVSAPPSDRATRDLTDLGMDAYTRRLNEWIASVT